MYIVFFILAFINVMGIFNGELPLSLINLPFVALFVFFGIRSYKKKQANTVAVSNQAPLCGTADYTCRVAGVTFKNPDGSSRQSILAAAVKDYENQLPSRSVSIQQYLFEGKPAFSIFYNGSLSGQIGNIPADCVNDVMQMYDKIADIQIVPKWFENDDGEDIVAAELYIYTLKG